MISKTARKAAASQPPHTEAEIPPGPTPDPPRPHRWFLIASGLLLAVWMLFLAYLAYGSK